MCYFYLALAIVLEVVAVVLMKKSEGLANLLPTIGMFVSFGLSFTFAAFAGKELDVGFVYAAWSAMAIVAVSFIGCMFFHESFSTVKLLCNILIVVGVVGINLIGQTH